MTQTSSIPETQTARQKTEFILLDTTREPANSETIIWGMSPGGRYAHAYTGEKSLEAGVPLCGMTCRPRHVLVPFGPENEFFDEVACPECRARLVFAKFMEPAERHPADEDHGTPDANGDADRTGIRDRDCPDSAESHRHSWSRSHHHPYGTS